MKTIHKYVIPTFEKFELEIPEDAELLDFKVQNNVPMLWALVDTNAALEKRSFVTYPTGAEIPYDEWTQGNYIGSVLFTNDTLVTHLFELVK